MCLCVGVGGAGGGGALIFATHTCIVLLLSLNCFVISKTWLNWCMFLLM